MSRTYLIYAPDVADDPSFQINAAYRDQPPSLYLFPIGKSEGQSITDAAKIFTDDPGYLRKLAEVVLQAAGELEQLQAAAKAAAAPPAGGEPA